MALWIRCKQLCSHQPYSLQ